ncbi:MAG TPA: type VI secretion system-associated protein TagF [Burkholderiales bacterium]
MSAQPAAQGALTPGWYGKIPATGDFVVRRLPEAFREAWDRWLQQSMDGGRERLGTQWQANYLSMPPWRFLLSAGMLTPQAWTGVMVPSVDAVGRQFPLTIACALPAVRLDLPGCLESARRWFDAIETIALDALAPRAEVKKIDAAVSACPFPADALRSREETPDATVPFRSARAQMLVASPAQAAGLVVQLAEPCAVWLNGASELIAPCALLCENLPSAAQFCGMMDGRWREHGWSSRDARGAEAA